MREPGEWVALWWNDEEQEWVTGYETHPTREEAIEDAVSVAEIGAGVRVEHIRVAKVSGWEAVKR